MKKLKNNETSGVREIARRANVSIGTVDRVIHNRTGVSVKTKKLINKIIQELDYQPNILASRLASRKVLRFAILIPHVSEETDYWAAPLEGIEQAEAELKQFGVTVGKFFYDQNNKDSFIKQSKLILKDKVDGVVLAPFFIAESITFTNACRKLDIPYVFINSDIPNQESLCYIGPNLFQSGYLGGHLINYAIGEKSKVLVINVSKEIKDYNHNRLLRKEEGLRAYFENNGKRNTIIKLDITKTDNRSIYKHISGVFAIHPDIKAIFVTNSRVGSVARYLEKVGKKGIFMVGYDYLNENIEFLEKGAIDFLICHKPREQGNRGIMSLYQSVVLGTHIDKLYFMPIDIVSKENHAFYRN
jgi:LacI family transcriptional regulator